MNNFKINIFKTTADVTVIPPEYYQFDVLEGTIACDAEIIVFNNPNPVTLYSNTNSLITGTTLYTDITLTNLAPYAGVRQGVAVYELVLGVIDLVTVIGNPC